MGQTAINPCPMCPVEVIVSDPETPPPPPGLTLSCFQMEASAGALEDGSADCQLLQVTAQQAACCQESCTLCPDSSNNDDGPPLFTSEQEIPAHDAYTSTPSAAISCEELASNPPIDFLQAVVRNNNKDCNDSQLRRSARWCQCNGDGMLEVECSLCSDSGLDPATLDNIVHPLTGTSCRFYAYEMSLLLGEECPNSSNIFDVDASALCCGTPAPNLCSICRGSGPILPGSSATTITTEAYGDITCGTAQAAASLIANDQACSEFLDTIGQHVVSSCCQDQDENQQGTEEEEEVVAPPSACMLSCNGELLPDMSRTDPVSGNSCESLSQAYAALSSEECDNAAQLFAFDAESFCCDNITPPNTCSICDDGLDELIFPREVPDRETVSMVVTYPEQVLFHFEGHTCGLVQRSASFLVGEKACRALKDSSRATRSCRCRSENLPEPSSAPRGIPTQVENSSANSPVLYAQTSRWLFRLLPASTFAFTVYAGFL